MKDQLVRFKYWEIIILGILTSVWVFLRPGFLPIFLIIPVLLVVNPFNNGSFLIQTSLNISILFLAILTLISLIYPSDLWISIPKVFGVVLGITIYFAIIRLGKNNKKNRARLLLGYILLGAGMTLLGIFGADWSTKYPNLTQLANTIPRLIPNLPGAELGFHPNAISGTLTLITPITILFAFGLKQRWGREWSASIFPSSPRWVSVLLWGAVGLESLWWLLSQARGAWLGLLGALLFLVLWHYRPLHRWAAWLVPLLGVIVIYTYWFQVTGAQLGNLSLDTLTGTNLSLKEGLELRLDIWASGFEVLRNFPLTGLGYNVFRQVVNVFFVGSDIGDIAHAHNIWLDVGVTLGWGGILVYLIMWYKNGKRLLSLVAQGDSWRERAALGLLAGWFGFVIFGLADTIPLGSKLGMVIWIALALGQTLPIEKTTSST